MPKELLHLTEQLYNVKVIYEVALSKNKSSAELSKLRDHMLELLKKIEERQRQVKDDLMS